MKLSLDQIEIDEQAMKECHRQCRERLPQGGVQMEVHQSVLLLRLLYLESKGFVALLMGYTLLLWWITPLFQGTYDVFVLFQSSMVVVMAIVYLFKEMPTHQQEVCFPTRIGGTKVFLYKCAIFTALSILCTSLFLLRGMLSYQYSCYQLLYVSLIPQICLHAITFQIAGRFHSLNATVATLFLLYTSYIFAYLLLVNMPLLMNQLLPYAGVLLIGCCCYDVYATYEFHRFMNIEGGYMLWN